MADIQQYMLVADSDKAEASSIADSTAQSASQSAPPIIVIGLPF